MDRAAVVEYLAALDGTEFAAITAEARGADLDAKALIERELEPLALNNDAAMIRAALRTD